jgi:hypothetical protein
MWLIAEYLPTALFSLRMSNATNAAAKTLLLPSPYCVKMTLLDASFRRDGVEATKLRFNWIKPLEVRVEPPLRAVVNGCFVKIQKLGDNGFGPAFALREYVAYDGNLRLAFRLTDLSKTEHGILSGLLLQINQLGKRGCFVQLISPPEIHEDLPHTFATPIGTSAGLTSAALLQPLDDMRPEATLPKVDPFSEIRVSQRDVIRRNVPTLVSYQRRQTSKGFTYYERSDQ